MIRETILLGAVAYDPRVVTIWEGIREHFQKEDAPMDFVLFSNYERQVELLLKGHIDIAWNTNLAYLQSDEWSGHACRAIAMRDTDLGWMTKIVAATGGPVNSLADLKNRTLALGSRDSGHAAILPVYFLEQQGMREVRDFRTLRFDSDVGKHGDTGTSEAEVMRAVLDGRADAGAIGSPFWNTVRDERLVPEGGLREIWTSPAYNHCMFTARPDLDREQERRFVEALLAMSYDNPVHRSVLDAEGLKRWLAPHLDGYGELRQAAGEHGFFEPILAKSA